MLSCAVALACTGTMAADPAPTMAGAASAPERTASAQADNTAINARDKGGDTKTPQTQSNNAQDRELLAAVRSSIVENKSLSTMAHNVKIVVEGGKATLRGPVKSQEEKAQIEALAKQVRGITATDNQLDVKAGS